MRRSEISGAKDSAGKQFSVLNAIQRLQQGVDVPSTPTQGEYISGAWALNLWDGVEPGGDWHKGCWFLATRENTEGPQIYQGPTIAVLGARDIYDCRNALRRMGHAQGWRRTPVWAARYARACVDMVAENIARETREGLPEEWWGLEPTAADLMRWLGHAKARRQVFTYCELMAEASTSTNDWWREWTRRRKNEIEKLYGAEKWMDHNQ